MVLIGASINLVCHISRGGWGEYGRFVGLVTELVFLFTYSYMAVSSRSHSAAEAVLRWWWFPHLYVLYVDIFVIAGGAARW